MVSAHNVTMHDENAEWYGAKRYRVINRVLTAVTG